MAVCERERFFIMLSSSYVRDVTLYIHMYMDMHMSMCMHMSMHMLDDVHVGSYGRVRVEH